MIRQLILLFLLNAFRCLFVVLTTSPYSSSSSSLAANSRSRSRHPDDDDDIRWANGEGARYARRFLFASAALLVLVEAFERQTLRVPSIPLISLYALAEWTNVGYGDNGPTAVVNERHRWLHRIVRYTIAGYLFIATSQLPGITAEDFARSFTAKAIGSFGTFVRLDDIAFEVAQPMVVAAIGGHYELLPALFERYVRIMAILTLASVSHARGKIWGRVAKQLRILSDEKRRGRREGGGRPLPSARPTAEVAMVGTTILALVLMIRLRPGEKVPRVENPLVSSTRMMAFACFFAAILLRRGAIPYFANLESRMSRYYEVEFTDVRRRPTRRLVVHLSLLSATISLGILLFTRMCIVRLSPPTLASTLFLLLIVTLATCYSYYYRVSPATRERDEMLISSLAFILRIIFFLVLERFDLNHLTCFYLLGRLILMFDHRPVFSRAWADAFFTAGVGITAMPGWEESAVGSVLLATIALTLFITLAMQLAEFQSFELMRIARESQEHLDHAVKQKLAGVASAIEQSRARLEVQNYDPSTLELLREVLVVMETQHDACHLANLAARGLAKTSSKEEFAPRDESAVVRDWSGRMKRRGVEMVVPERAKFGHQQQQQPQISLNWNLAYYFVFSVTRDFSREVRARRGGNRITLNCEIVSTVIGEEITKDYLVLTLEEGFCWRFGALRRREIAWLAGILGVETDDAKSADARTIRIPGKRVLSSESRTHDRNGEDDVNETTPTRIPPGCVFGILDDVALVRMATLSFLSREFDASPNSFACGETAEDYERRFLPLVSERKPDVLIIDYFLEFSKGDAVRGTTVARRCREERGYKGVILIHTSNESVREELDYTVVDGFLGKSFSRLAYEGVVGEALMRRRNF